MKYRIKSKQTVLEYLANTKKSVYCVQIKIPYIPIWFKVTGYFNDKYLAEEYIDSIKDEK